MTASGALIFGTDGVRDRPGRGFLAEAEIERLASATASVLDHRERFGEDFPARRGSVVAIARDTRKSGEGIFDMLARSLQRHGFSVADLGVLPTPGAAYLSAAWPEVTLGIVISASHNPAEYNGIKFVAPTGAKISPAFEKAVSDAYWRKEEPKKKGAGKVLPRSGEAVEAYSAHLVRACRKPERLKGRKVVLDAAHGACYRVAPEVFRLLGMEVEALGNAPDGKNINQGCGALHPEALANALSRAGAPFGFCFDGDGDRMIPVAGKNILDGDHVLYLAGKHYRRAGLLPHGTVVATVMSNIGLEIALRAHGIALLRTDVGDRHVYLAMVEKNHPVGGEQSGHIIFLEDARTGDGILAAIKLLDLLEGDSLDLEREAAPMKRYPQLLRNVPVREKLPIESLGAVQSAVEAARSRLGDEGRILLRYSGTEPLLRVMLEGPDQGTVETLTEEICEAVRESLEG
jgi:phosphoglucosamine mutase